MSAVQKFAWFNLAVIALTVVVVLSLLPLLGKGSIGGLGFLGLMGLGVLYFRKKPGQVLADERDLLILRRSWIAAYSLFWVIFVLCASLVSPLVYGFEGAVPVWVIQICVFGGIILVNALASIAILVQYAGGSSNAG